MEKVRATYVCQQCGYSTPRWEGQCRSCQQWNTLHEEFSTPKKQSRDWTVSSSAEQKTEAVVNLAQTQVQDTTHRCSTFISELDRVLGSGLVSGSYTLVGGDPGIGKSTLLLQLAGTLGTQAGQKVLYVSAEESVSQTSLRAQRLGIKTENVEVTSESDLHKIIRLVEKRKPSTLIVDSIQTVYLPELSSAPGTVTQVRECASQLMGVAKNLNVSVFLVGHITKEGSLAGPKVLEHIVDTVLSFEGDRHHQFRLLRATKNRFGATNELGVFQMSSSGLKEVANPSELFLEERRTDATGSAVCCAMEGTRPLLCEIQTLTHSTHLAMPRRTSLGFDLNRVHLLIAALDKHLNLKLHKNDVFVNVVGGLKVSEPAADLTVAASLISSALTQPVNPKTCFLGEIGLTGEVRAVSFIEERLKEASKLGFNKWVVPHSNKKHLKDSSILKEGEIIWIKHIKELESILKN